jgi:outer membrane protein assembly factor BamB
MKDWNSLKHTRNILSSAVEFQLNLVHPSGTVLPIMEPVTQPQSESPQIRWWPGVFLLLGIVFALIWVYFKTDWPFQKRNLTNAQIITIGGMLLVVWWTFFSRARKRLRQGITFSLLGAFVLAFALFRVRGMSGDMVPIIEFRWARATPPVVVNPSTAQARIPSSNIVSFPQFYGPNRNGVLPLPLLATNWSEQPPQVLWRQPVGAGWSGFAIVGELCLTQEQHGEEECVIARSLGTGAEVWRHTDRASFGNTIAGEGPRATPTILGDRVFTFGSSGLLNCLVLATGQRIWLRDVVKDSAGKVPMWGATSSPLIVDGLVIVHGGEKGTHSLFAYRTSDGTPVWKGGTASSYATPVLATLAGVPQVVAFNDGSVSGHDLQTGALLWQRPWGNGNVVCASPVIVSSNRVLFSSGYGVGAELLQLSARTNKTIAVERIWKSLRMKAKFAHLFIRDDSVFGLDDGILACVDLSNGEQRWKEGRYGHGQGLVVGEHYLLMSEGGELVLLDPTRNAANELARFRIFNSKTWNPPAMVGGLLLVRNDREAVCLRLPTSKSD